MIDGGRVQAQRQKLGLTQRQAAKAAGITRMYWSRIETGSCAPEKYRTLQAVARALGWTIAELLDEEA